MKKLIRLENMVAVFLFFLLVLTAHAESGVPVSVNGGNVTLYSGTTSGDQVSVSVPNATGKAQVITNDIVRLYVDGAGVLAAPRSNPASGTAATSTSTSGTIDTTIFYQRVTDAGAITGVILEDGVVNGQLLFLVVDKDASGSVTMAAEATSNVCAGTAVVIAAGEGALFIYDSTDTCWSTVGIGHV